MSGAQLQQEPTSSTRSPSAPLQLARFFRSWMQDPLAIGAVAPSGRLLAKLMVKDLYPGARVVELGAGTGTLTEAILDRGVLPSDLYLIEQHREFAALLEQRFPAVTVLRANAVSLTSLLGHLAGSVDFVISGLPLMLFRRSQKMQLLDEAFGLLRPGGCFHQFTYAGRCPISRELLVTLGLRASLIGVAPINIPPAFVYRIRSSAGARRFAALRGTGYAGRP